MGLTAIYRLHPANVKRFNDEIAAYKTQSRKLDTEIIIGDININILRNNTISHEYLDIRHK